MKDVLTAKPEIFFLTYDEPLKEEYWVNFYSMVPWAQRIDGVKGFDAAHKACAEAAKGKRVFIVDGDNSVEYSFLRIPSRPSVFFKNNWVLSWAAKNSVNGLIYGNGGIKNWSRETLLNMKSHENAEDDSMAVDFCFGIKYVPQPESLSTANVNQTPFQAFRAGFREGVKMSLVDGARLDPKSKTLTDDFQTRIPKSNLERLKIWCSVGADVSNGLWAIYGARLGCQFTFDHKWDFKKIHDYDWFQAYWENDVAPKFSGFQQQCEVTGYRWSDGKLASACELVGQVLEKKLALKVPLFSRPDSEFFKSVYFNRPRGVKVWN